MIDTPFWLDKRVLLTGHTGFKGSWLALWLNAMGAKVSGFALPAENPSLYLAADVERDVTSCIGDVRNLDEVKKVFQAVQPELVFHLAACSLVIPAYHDPVQTFETNVLGTVNVLEAARECASVQAIINVTTDKCYDNKEFVWGYRETDELGGHEPYSSSKACAELVTQAYRKTYFQPQGVAIATARAGNVIGGGDWAPYRLIPDVINAFIKGEPVKLRHPEAIRPWQHVLDPLAGYLRLAQCLYEDKMAISESWNFGPEIRDAQPVSQVVDQLAQEWGNGASWIPDETSYPKESNYLKLDTSKAQARLGWRPTLSLKEGLSWTLDWYKAQAQGVCPREKTLSQIEQFMQRLTPSIHLPEEIEILV